MPAHLIGPVWWLNSIIDLILTVRPKRVAAWTKQSGMAWAWASSICQSSHKHTTGRKQAIQLLYDMEFSWHRLKMLRSVWYCISTPKLQLWKASQSHGSIKEAEKLGASTRPCLVSLCTGNESTDVYNVSCHIIMKEARYIHACFWTTKFVK